MKILLLLPLLLASCAGTHSDLKEGIAYQMNETQAKSVIDSVVRSNIVGDRMLPGGPLTSTGYDRNWLGTDTHTYTATAIPVTKAAGYTFEIRHHGTFFKGPSKARRMLREINERAALVGTKVQITR